MKLYIAEDVQRKFPDLEEIMLPVYDVTAQKDDQVLTKDCFEKPLKKYSGNNFYDQKYFVVFKEFCQEMEIDTNINPPSVENLFKRYQKSGKFPQINNIVDAANKISLETLVPTGVFDLDQIKGDMVIKFTQGEEEFHPLGGGVEILPAGITIIADSEKILNFFPYRDSVYQKITNKTKNILILADKVKGMDRQAVEDAVIKIGNLISKVSGGKIGEMFSSKEKNINISIEERKSPEKVEEIKIISTKKPRILTGDTPTGKLHIGHYVGTLKNRIDLQKSYDTYILLANIHAYANDYTKTDLINQNVYEVFLDNLAVGIDPNVSTIFLESGVPEILELYGIFSMMVKHSRALRNPSVKEEIKYKKLDPSVGFVIYPILQAADILGFNADLVPVGEDQLPVIEQTREIARDFNKVFGETFVLPQAKVGFIPRLVGIDGKSKMSKSGSNAILLSEDPETLRKKVNSIFTDPARIHGNEPGKVEGNPVFIYHDAFNPDKEEVKDLKDRYQKGNISDREVKEKLYLALNNFLNPIREKRKYYETNPQIAKEILIEGTKKARIIVQETLFLVKEKMKLNQLLV